MAAWQFDLEPIPAGLALIEGVPAIHLPSGAWDHVVYDLTAADRKDLFAAIGAMLPEGQAWSDGFRIWGDTKRSDIQVYADGKKIEALKIRLDVRNVSFELIDAVCALAQRFDWVFVGDRGAVLQPVREVILRAIEHSPARAFVEDPQTALTQAAARMTEPS